MTPELRIGRRQVLRRLGALVAASGLLAACSPTTAVAPTSPPTTGAAAPAVPQVQATTAPATAAPAATPTAAAKPTTAPAPPAVPQVQATTAAAAPAAAASSKPKAIIGIIQEPTSMDPTADATASIATTLRDNLYEGLVRLDGSGKIVGSLAKSWDVSPDGTTLTSHLVSGAKWHDGPPSGAQDVKFV